MHPDASRKQPDASGKHPDASGKHPDASGRDSAASRAAAVAHPVAACRTRRRASPARCLHARALASRSIAGSAGLPSSLVLTPPPGAGASNRANHFSAVLLTVRLPCAAAGPPGVNMLPPVRCQFHCLAPLLLSRVFYRRNRCTLTVFLPRRGESLACVTAGLCRSGVRLDSLPLNDCRMRFAQQPLPGAGSPDAGSRLRGVGLFGRCAEIKQGRSDQGSSPCSTPLRSPARTPAASRCTHGLRRGL